MNQHAQFTIELAERFVIAGRYREYMAQIRTSSGCVLYNSGWDRSKKRVEERAKHAQRELERQNRFHANVEQMSYDEALDCQIEIEEELTNWGVTYIARVRKCEHGPILFETDRYTNAIIVEQYARTYLQRLFRLTSNGVKE